MKNESEPEEENSKYEPEIIKKSETPLEVEDEKRISEDEENISESSQVNSEDENERNDGKIIKHAHDQDSTKNIQDEKRISEEVENILENSQGNKKKKKK